MKRNKNHQLSFTPKIDVDKISKYFSPIEGNEDKSISLEEIELGLAGLWRGLGSKGMLSPETALFIVKSKQTVDDSRLIQSKTKFQEMRNQQLAELLNIGDQAEPENEYKPEEKK